LVSHGLMKSYREPTKQRRTNPTNPHTTMATNRYPYSADGRMAPVPSTV
jgi:hypothetical protein